MNTEGKGLLAVWTDIAPAAEAEFIDWYDREHLGERAAVPGFLNARLYQAVEGKPRYFAAYDTERPQSLGAPPYVEALAHQTTWSNRMFEHFRDTTRVIAGQSADQGAGMGGAMLAMLLRPAPGALPELTKRMGDTLTGEVAAMAGIVRVTVAPGVVAVLGGNAVQAASQARDDPQVLALLVEGSDVSPLRSLMAGKLEEEQLSEAGAEAIQSGGIYRLQCAFFA